MTKRLYKLMDWARIEGVVYSEEDNPHEFLGATKLLKDLLIQAFFPNAKKVYAVVCINKIVKEYKMELADDEGFYACLIPTPITPYKYSYFFRVVNEDGVITEVEDPYRFDSTIDKKALDKFNAGINYEIYDYLGAHVRKIDGVKGTSFAVWAPNAMRVSVVGDFNAWDGRCHQMRRLSDSGVFEIFIPDVITGDNYKYEIKLKGSRIAIKSDPYAFYSEYRPDTASVVYDISGYKWTDGDWIKNRAQFNSKDKPMSVYEVHLGSVYRNEDGSFMNYREIAEKLAKYVLDMGYTHIELMPVMEHPLDESWGYEVIGYYSVTSRYGTPDDFMYFMNYMHEKGIAVIIDWVPAHFPADVHGLSEFDGTCLYEHEDRRKGIHPDWGTKIFNYGRAEVSNYLISNALFWINKYHADGIRVDAVASMLYLDYGKQGGEWIPNIYGGNENLEAIELLKHLNSINEKQKTGALIIAEESSAWPKITGEFEDGGLGFNYKWNMGWMNDFIEFIKYDPYFRGEHYYELTFSMIYAYAERFILPFSHDEVTHGKGSMIAKMPGEYEDKFANLKASYGYMFTHPGKKLLFMGQDIAEFDEWSEDREVQWNLLEFEKHRQLNDYVKDLLHLYKSNKALFELDNVISGFEWINNISTNENIIVFLRKSRNEEDVLLTVINFSNVEYEKYKIGVPFEGKYKEIFNSDAEKYGGEGRVNKRVKPSKKDECDKREDSIRITVAPLSISIFKCNRVTQE